MVAAAMVFAGCSKDNGNNDDNGKGAALSIDKTAISAAHTAGTYSVAVTSNTAWTVAVTPAEATWCNAAPASGEGDKTVTVNVGANPASAQRAATITFTAGTLTRAVAVTQAGAPPALTTDISSIDAPAAAGSYAVAVTSNATWSATVNAGATWCTISSASATGNGTVTVNVTENPIPVTRSATVTVTAGTLNRQVVVTQEPAVPKTLCAQCCWDGTEWVDCYVTTNAYPFNSSSDNTDVKWSGNEATYYSGARSDRDGRANTAAISSTGNSAVQICKNLGTGWYLPAYEELVNMSTGYINSPLNGRSGANLLATPDLYYWSSTELYNNSGRYSGNSTTDFQVSAVAVNTAGSLANDTKTYGFHVRCAWRN
jgi:hypothetical protein